MANNKERRALIVKALESWSDLRSCLVEIQTRKGYSVEGCTTGELFMATSSSDDWGQGAWQVYSNLNGLRTAAEIMRFYLDIDDLDRHAAGDLTPRMFPAWKVL